VNTHEEAQRGRTAEQLLESPMFREAMDGIRAGIIEKWRSCPIRDREGQHELKLMDKLLSDIEGYIKQVADSGKMAKITLEREEKLEKLNKAGVY